MNLIDLFESKPVQDVGTFNSIFKGSPILGHDYSKPVAIKELIPGVGRKLQVGDLELFVELKTSVPTVPKKTKGAGQVRRIQRKNKNYYEKKTTGENVKTIARALLELTPWEYYTLACLRCLEQATVPEIAKKLKVTNYRTIQNHMHSLLEKGYVKVVRKSRCRVFAVDNEKQLS
jgi:DNA-binding transcriptional ArsR family regulator